MNEIRARWSMPDGRMAGTPITLTIFDNAEEWLRINLPDMSTDRVACVRPVARARFNPDGLTEYEDVEDTSDDRVNEEDEDGNRYGTLRKSCDMAAHVQALRLLCAQIGRTLVGGLKSPFELVDPGNWDAEVVDAYYQLVMLGEVVYG